MSLNKALNCMCVHKRLYGYVQNDYDIVDVYLDFSALTCSQQRSIEIKDPNQSDIINKLNNCGTWNTHVGFPKGLICDNLTKPNETRYLNNLHFWYIIWVKRETAKQFYWHSPKLVDDFRARVRIPMDPQVSKLPPPYTCNLMRKESGLLHKCETQVLTSTDSEVVVNKSVKHVI